MKGKREREQEKIKKLKGKNVRVVGIMGQMTVSYSWAVASCRLPPTNRRKCLSIASSSCFVSAESNRIPYADLQVVTYVGVHLKDNPDSGGKEQSTRGEGNIPVSAVVCPETCPPQPPGGPQHPSPL